MSHKVTPKTDTKAFNAVERRINLNYAVALIERGKIASARELLDDLRRSSVSVSQSTPSRLMPYIHGYIALCDHLGGSFEAALSGYKSVLAQLIEARELRAISIFKRHLGDLLRSTEQHEEADLNFNLAINAASQSQQRDVLNLAKASYSRHLASIGEIKRAKQLIQEAKTYASNMGLHALKSDCFLADSRLKSKRGELGPAAESASASIALCIRYGLRLRKLSSLVTYGEIQLIRGKRNVALNVLRDAQYEAEQLGYQLKASHASEIVAKWS